MDKYKYFKQNNNPLLCNKREKISSNNKNYSMTRAFSFLAVFVFIFGFSQKKWTLQECVDYAVQNNLQVIQSNLSKKIQDNELEVSKRAKLPGVSGTLNNNLNFGQSQDVFGNNARNDNFNTSASVGGEILLYNHGRLEKEIRKSELDVEASQHDIEKIKNDISLQIAQQYLNILLNREVEKINQSAVANAEKLYKRAKITTEVGTTAQTILAEAEASLAREKQNLKSSEINTKSALFSLSQLLQLEDYKNFDVEDVATPNKITSELISVADVLEKAYETQPQIKAAESRIKVAEAQTEVTKTYFWPSVSASAGLSSFYYNSLVSNLLEKSLFTQYKNNFGQQLGLTATIPIFNKGITRLQVQQAKINEEVAKTTLSQQKQELLQNVQRAQFDAEGNYELYVAAVEAEKSSKLALDFAEKSYEAGRTTIYDLNIARNNFANAQGSVAQTKYNYLFSLKVLEFYAGIPITL